MHVLDSIEKNSIEKHFKNFKDYFYSFKFLNVYTFLKKYML